MTEKRTGPDVSQMEVYVAAGFKLIPLHKWDSRSTHKGKQRDDGKRPLHSDWVKRPYASKGVIEEFVVKKGHNAGVRLTASQLVVDVDPRNFPLENPDGPKDGPRRDAFAELCRDVGLKPDDFPRVETGSGGLHVYMAKPADVSVLDSLEKYPGVEFKTKGRQVVSAGSRHPNGRWYEWDPLAPSISEGLPPVPERLLTVIRRPARSASTAAGGGEYDQEQIAKMLDALDPGDFRDQSDWMTLMMACHHASGGAARDEFIEWSTRDPKYQDDGWIIGRRWDSLHRKLEGPAVTYRTLHKALRDRGKEQSIPHVTAAQDFDDDFTLEGGGQLVLGDDSAEATDEWTPEHELVGPLTGMNQRFWAVNDGGSFRIMEEQFDPELQRKVWVSYKMQDFQAYLANRKVEKPGVDKKGKPTTEVVPITKAWLEWGNRRTARGIVFDPERDHPGWLNLWTGWGVEPKPGDWSLTQELIRDVLCDRDDASADFVMKWMAYLVQKPWLQPEVALCFNGLKGTGKGTLGRALVALAGRHGMQVSSAEHLTGRFNSHLRDLLVLFGDEAVKPGDKASASVMKALITESDMAYEAKGKDIKRGINRVHVVLASNDDWFVDAGMDGERRYFVARVNESRRGDEAFFDALNDQLYKQGGLAAMLHDLQLYDLGRWAPRGRIPQTAALADQKLRNLPPVGSWWMDQLESETPCVKPPGGEDWSKGPIKLFYAEVQEHFRQWCDARRINFSNSNRGNERHFAAELRKYCPEVKTEAKAKVPEDHIIMSSTGWGGTNEGRARAYEFPSLQECRASFERMVGYPVFAERTAEPDPLDL